MAAHSPRPLKNPDPSGWTGRRLCSTCWISIGYRVSEKPIKLDLKQVDPTTDNEILKQIMLVKHKFVDGCRLLILVDGSRYGIEICKIDYNTIYLKQYFLHYDGSQLIPTNYRFVKICNPI